MGITKELGQPQGSISGYPSFGSYIIQAGFLCALPLFYFTFRAPILISFALFISGGVFLISAQPVCIRITQDLLPGNVSFASSLILGFSPGLAAITIIFLGKVADRIGIARLIMWELLPVVFNIILLFSYPIAERKSRVVKEI